MRGLSASASVATSSPRTVARATVLDPQALEDLDRRRLARAVRTEEAEDLASGDLEVDAIHRDQVAVALGQAGDRMTASVATSVGRMHGPPASSADRPAASSSSTGASKPPDQSMSRIVPPSRGPGVGLGCRRTEAQVRVDRPGRARRPTRRARTGSTSPRARRSTPGAGRDRARWPGRARPGSARRTSSSQRSAACSSVRRAPSDASQAPYSRRSLRSSLAWPSSATIPVRRCSSRE